MRLDEILRRIQKDPKDALYYLQGTIRQKLYDSNFWKILLRPHIVEQYEYRKKVASKCLEKGNCICCSCTTPDLFFANKPCSIANPKYKSCADPRFRKEGMPFEALGTNTRACYQKMLSKKQWETFKATSET